MRELFSSQVRYFKYPVYIYLLLTHELRMLLMIPNCNSSLLDTKYLASTPPLKELINNSVLGGMLDIFKYEPFQLPTVGKSYYNVFILLVLINFLFFYQKWKKIAKVT